MKIYQLLFVILVASFLASCANNEPKPLPRDDALYKACKNPRPQICTREYRPVCGTKDTGIRCVTMPCASQALKTYGNACTACADSSVSVYRSGACVKPTK